MILVVIDTDALARVEEALRAAVGLGLRGDPVQVHLARPVPSSPAIDRALGTLGVLGQRVVHGVGDLPSAIHSATAVEVWR